jgi:hypothetical protein
MKVKLNLIKEAITTEEDAKTKTKTKSKPSVFDTFNKKPDQPLAKKEKSQDRPKGGEAPAFKVSPKDETLRKSSNIRMTDRAVDLMSKMKSVEADPDDPGYASDQTRALPKKTTFDLVKPENIPAVLNKELAEKGILNPSWNVVANLPGNMATAIRTVGRKLFKSFTNTPTDKIVMIGNVFNGGPNTDREINAVAKWLNNSGQEKSTGDIDFNDFMPGYTAEIKLYDAANCRFLLVNDFAGRYIYVWPHADSVTTSNKPQLTKEEITASKRAEYRLKILAGIPIVEG